MDVGNQASVGTAVGRRRSATVSDGWIRLAALAGLCLDGLTTWLVFGIASYRELNPVLTGLWQGHPLLVAGYFGIIGLGVAASTRRRSRLSTAIGTYVIVVMGVFGGVNNLALFVFGPPGLLDLLAGGLGVSGSTAVVIVVPACGLIVAYGIARLRHGPLP